MDLDAFRRTLLDRQREAARSTRARLRGEEPDERLLDELDAALFSRGETTRLADSFKTAQGASARISARSRLALALRWGPLARMRPLDRALSRALRTGREDEALGIAEQIETSIVQEGSVPAPARRAEGRRENVEDVPDERDGRHGDYLSLSGLTRVEDLRILAASARSVLEGSAFLIEDLWNGPERRSADDMDTDGSGKELQGDPRGSRGSRGPIPSAFSSVPGSGAAGRAGGVRERLDASRAPRSFEAGLGLLMEDPGLYSSLLDSTSIRGAVQEIATHLDLERRLPSVTFMEASAPVPVVVEEDPPVAVSLVLPSESGPDRLAQALDAAGRALEVTLRSGALPEEHRLHSDRAVGFAIGALLSSLASEHASLRREPRSHLRAALGREILASRLAASLFLARSATLSGQRTGDSITQAAEDAVLRPVRAPFLPFEDEPLLDSADRLRGHILFTGLRELFRTRFGNLWYREKAVGRILEEICEPGGSVVAAEITTGLSLPAPRAESLIESWREERRRIE